MFLGCMNQFDPVSISAMTAVGGGLIETIAGLFGKESSKDLVAKQVKAAQQAAKQQAAAQLKALQEQTKQVTELERQKQDQQVYEASVRARSQQMMALYAVGGVAVLVGGIFVLKALSKKKGR